MDRKILVIDDDAAIHRVLVQHLSDEHTEVCSAKDGRSGVDLARQCKPDLILLDVDMPGLTGHEVCRMLKFDPETQGIPVAFLTASGSIDEKVQGLDVGAMDYILKPFDPCEVAARTRAAFRMKSMVELAESRTMLDRLTTLGNRSAFEQHLRSELARAHRSSEPLACAMLEPDQLDWILETEGESVRDGVLHDIAAVLIDICREGDRVFRYSARRFAIVAPNLGPMSIMNVGERLQESIVNHPMLRKRTPQPITVSVGLAISRFSVGHTVADEAGEALLRARQLGGDMVLHGGELTDLALAD